jgi:Zn finger protein HypA/HybF involved in hydrogenase expression
MNAICKCNQCGAQWSCRAADDPDTNAFELTGKEQNCPECGSGDFEVISTEDEELSYQADTEEADAA